MGRLLNKFVPVDLQDYHLITIVLIILAMSLYVAYFGSNNRSDSILHKFVSANLQKNHLFTIILIILALSFTYVVLSSLNNRSNSIPHQTILSKDSEGGIFTLSKGGSHTVHIADEVITISVIDNGYTIGNAVNINISGTIGSRTYRDFWAGKCIHFHPILITYVSSNGGNDMSKPRFRSAKFRVDALDETANDTNLCPYMKPVEYNTKG